MPRGVYFQAASRWPHMFLTLSPTYMGLAQAAYDFTVRYLRGEMPGAPPASAAAASVKQLAVAEMRIKLEQIKALWFQAVSEARVDPTQDQRLRAYAAQFSTMETRERPGAPGDPNLRRPFDAEVAAAGAHLSRQPLRLADAALDSGNLPERIGRWRAVREGERRRNDPVRPDRTQRSVHTG